MKYKLIAMDLDGTLNNSQKIITEKTRSALMQAQQQGIRLALASARPSPGLFKERDILHLQEFGGLLMSYNGGRIVDAATGAALFETAMDIAQTKQVLRQLEALPVTPILDDGRQFYVTDAQGYKVPYECQNNNMICSEVGNLADFLSFAPIKILMSVLPEQLPRVQSEIAAFLPEDLTVVQTAPFYLEVIPKVINKGQGIRDICRTIGISAEEVIAFGDAANDIPMLRAAGMGVAMGNASEETKAAADYITATNDEDGIAAALQYFEVNRMTKLLFIRHGQSEANLARTFAGNTDAALTDLGLRQAAATADYIASAYTVDAVYASDLQRAFYTGKAVADRLGLPVRPHKGLREIFAGEWEGKPFTYLEATYPETFAGLWRKDIGNSACDGGESVAQLMQRILATVREIAEANPGKTVVLATHATPIRCMECFCRGNDLSQMKDIPWVTNASVTEIHYENGTLTEVVSSYNQHLADMVSTLPANV